MRRWIWTGHFGPFLRSFLRPDDTYSVRDDAHVEQGANGLWRTTIHAPWRALPFAYKSARTAKRAAQREVAKDEESVTRIVPAPSGRGELVVEVPDDLA